MKRVAGTVTFGAESIAYEVEFRASRRRTLGIEVHPDSRVLVRAPLDCSPDVVAERVQKRAGWISRQLGEFARYRPRTPARSFVSGESHIYLGRQYRLRVTSGEVAGVKLTRGQLVVSLPGKPEPGRVKTLLRRWYLDRARTVFAEVMSSRLRRFAEAQPPRLLVRSMSSRWGSLSRAGNMTLNVDLVRAPRSCIEYVVTHELCHLAHRDHDAHFYAHLDRMMPDWRRRKERLETALL